MELADLNLDNIYSYADYLKWTFEERVELIKGKIFKMSPAPNRSHQTISGKIHLSLGNFLKKGDGCQVFYAPFDVRLPGITVSRNKRKTSKVIEDKDILTVLQPDICVICDSAKLDEKGCIGAPDIVVEILSPSNNSKELKYKYEVYEQAGVKEYWVVSPQDHTFLMYTLKDGKYIPSRIMTEGDLVSSSVLKGYQLDLTELFEK